MNYATKGYDIPLATSYSSLILLPQLLEEEVLEARHKFAIQNYETKNPMDSIVHEIFVDYFDEFIAGLKIKGKHLSIHVIREMDAFMNCGIPEAGGYSSWRCGNCKGSPKTIAFSCKCRGFCPRCGGRRMSQSAANAVDFIFPNQTARQWVISLPFHLRYWVAADANLMDKILAIINNEIGNLYKSKAASEHGIASGQTGSISYIQSAGGQINRNPHIHLLHLEGVFDEGVENIRNPKFFTTSKPTDEEVITVSEQIAQRVIIMLQRRGLLKTEDNFCETKQPKLDGIDLIREASVKGYIATGPRSGQEVRRIRSLGIVGEEAKLKSTRCVSVNGFSIHANSMVKRHRPQEMEQLIRYMARPPLSLDRLSYDAEGNIILALRHRFSDGTHSLLFSPMEFLEKISSIIPPPRRNLVRYFGCFAPRAKIRPSIVPKPTKSADEIQKARSYWRAWAELMKRVFQIDILRCDECEGRLKFVSVHFVHQKQAEVVEIHCNSQAPPLIDEHQYQFNDQLLDSL